METNWSTTSSNCVQPRYPSITGCDINSSSVRSVKAPIPAALNRELQALGAVFGRDPMSGRRSARHRDTGNRRPSASAPAGTLDETKEQRRAGASGGAARSRLVRDRRHLRPVEQASAQCGRQCQQRIQLLGDQLLILSSCNWPFASKLSEKALLNTSGLLTKRKSRNTPT